MLRTDTLVFEPAVFEALPLDALPPIVLPLTRALPLDDDWPVPLKTPTLLLLRDIKSLFQLELILLVELGPV